MQNGQGRAGQSHEAMKAMTEEALLAQAAAKNALTWGALVDTLGQPSCTDTLTKNRWFTARAFGYHACDIINASAMLHEDGKDRQAELNWIRTLQPLAMALVPSSL